MCCIQRETEGAHMSVLDQIPLSLLIVAALTLGLAPFFPEPHIWEKLRMLVAGDLVKPVDIFDLALHAAPFVVLGLKLLRMATQSGQA
jgi:hypothetical protein